MLKFGKKAKLAALAALSAPVVAFAAIPADVTAALTEAKTDVNTIGGAVFIIVIAIAAWRLMKRAT